MAVLKKSLFGRLFPVFGVQKTCLGLKRFLKECNRWNNRECVTYNIVKIREKKLNLIKNSRKNRAFGKISFF
jgi:hypothetical protein